MLRPSEAIVGETRKGHQPRNALGLVGVHAAHNASHVLPAEAPGLVTSKTANSWNQAPPLTFREHGDQQPMIKPLDPPGRRSSDLAFEEVMRPHLDGIYGRAYALTGSVQDAEDLTQEVCIRASSRLEEIAQHENPRARLMRVLYGLFVDLVRSRRRSRSG